MSAPSSPKKEPAAAPASPVKRPAETQAGPAAKKAKVDPAAMRKQIEYYFSDENLSNDKFFHDKISEDKDGWLDMALIQSCNKIKSFGVSNEVLLDSIKESALESKNDASGCFVRRTVPLPALSASAGARGRQGKDVELKKKTQHDGGVLIKFSELPEITWHVIKDEMKKQLPDTARVLFATNVSEKKTCVMLMAPFDGDVEVVEALEIAIEGTKLKFEVCYGETLRECVKELPKHIVKRREALAKNRQKLRQKPVLLSGQKFANMATLRGKMKEIIMSRKDGQQMIEGSPDTGLVRAVMAHHPRAEEKMKDVKAIKVDVSAFEANTPGGKKSRCFHLIKEDGTVEDISMIKCLGELERKVNEGIELDSKASAAAPASPKKEAPGSPKKEAPGSPKKEAPASPKKEAPGSPKKVEA